MNLKLLPPLARTGYRWLVTGASSLQSLLLLGIRLYWGWGFFQTGKGKLMNLDRTTQFFHDLGIPLPGLNATLAGATECFGGLLLLIGLASRLTAIPLLFTMLIAYLTAESEALKAIFTEPDKFFGAAPFLFLAASAIVLVFGPGKISIDGLLERIFDKSCGNAPRPAAE